MHPIHLITTGGTLDKEYCPLRGELTVGPPVVANVLGNAGFLPGQLTSCRFLQKDSLDITAAERMALVALVAEHQATRILITHGTDTMNDTARYLAACVSSNKTIVLTGAMVPRSIENSDADFNIGFALAAVKLLPPGIYIAMHGKALPYTEYIKDRTTGRFIQRGPQA